MLYLLHEFCLHHHLQPTYSQPSKCNQFLPCYTMNWTWIFARAHFGQQWMFWWHATKNNTWNCTHLVGCQQFTCVKFCAWKVTQLWVHAMLFIEHSSCSKDGLWCCFSKKPFKEQLTFGFTSMLPKLFVIFNEEEINKNMLCQKALLSLVEH